MRLHFTDTVCAGNLGVPWARWYVSKIKSESDHAHTEYTILHSEVGDNQAERLQCESTIGRHWVTMVNLVIQTISRSPCEPPRLKDLSFVRQKRLLSLKTGTDGH